MVMLFMKHQNQLNNPCQVPFFLHPLYGCPHKGQALDRVTPWRALGPSNLQVDLQDGLS
jgi:hypothetical protein